MNGSAFLGFGVALLVLLYSAWQSDATQGVLLDPHALIIVIGGTFAAACVSFPVGRIFKLSILAVKKLTGMVGQDYEGIIQDVITLAENVHRDPRAIQDSLEVVTNPFLREGLQLLVDGASEEQLLDIMEARIETFRRRYASEVNMFRTIGKFPPAFGLLGTTFGMIALLSKLGQEGTQKLLGPAMAIGLVATLYGIGLTNFIFIPIAESLNSLGAEDFAARKMVLEGLIMVRRRTHPLLVEEKMKSFLLPSERKEFYTQKTA